MKNLKALGANLLFSFTVMTFGQSGLSGRYCVENRTHGTFGQCYFFGADGKFDYFSGGDLGLDTTGKGEYSIEDGNLILDHNRSIPQIAGYHKAHYWKNSRDSVMFTIRATYWEGYGLPNVDVAINDGALAKGTDQKGEVTFTLPKSSTNYDVELSYLGFETYLLTLRGDHNYSVEVNMVRGSFRVPILHQVDTLRILEMGRDRLKLQGQDGRVVVWEKSD